MGTIEFKINGNNAGKIYFKNDGGVEVCDYLYEYFTGDATLGTDAEKTGTVSHRRSNGIATLAYLILSHMRGE